MRKASQHRSEKLPNNYAVESIEITIGQLAYEFVRTLAVSKVEPSSTESDSFPRSTATGVQGTRDVRDDACHEAPSAGPDSS